LKKILFGAIVTSSLLLAETNCVNNDDVQKIVEFNESKVASYQRYIGALKKEIKELKIKLGEKTENEQTVLPETTNEKGSKFSYSASNKTFVYLRPKEESKTNTVIEAGKEIDILSCDKRGWCVSADNLYFKKFFLRVRMLE